MTCFLTEVLSVQRNSFTRNHSAINKFICHPRHHTSCTLRSFPIHSLSQFLPDVDMPAYLQPTACTCQQQHPHTYTSVQTQPPSSLRHAHRQTDLPGQQKFHIYPPVAYTTTTNQTHVSPFPLHPPPPPRLSHHTLTHSDTSHAPINCLFKPITPSRSSASHPFSKSPARSLTKAALQEEHSLHLLLPPPPLPDKAAHRLLQDAN